MEDSELGGEFAGIAGEMGEASSEPMFRSNLWDGSVVPLGPGRGEIASCDSIARGGPAADPVAPTRDVLRAPCGRRTRRRGGSLIDAMRRIDREKAAVDRARLDKRLILKSLWPFLFTPGGRGAPSGYRGAVAERLEGGRDDRGSSSSSTAMCRMLSTRRSWTRG